MQHSTKRLLSMGTGWIVVWTALVAVPPLALAGSRAGYDIGIRPPQARTSTAPVKADMVTACQTQYQATSTTLDALRPRIQAARASNDLIQMRAVLDEVLQRQTAMQNHMKQCMQTMGMSPSMHGGMDNPQEGHDGMRHGS